MDQRGILGLDKGLMTGMARTQIPAGGLVVADEWVYLEKDALRPHKMPGRTTAGALASSVSVKGIEFAQFEDAADQILLLANSRLYEADAAATLGAWTEALDQQTVSPDAFTMSGDFLKVLPDIRNGIIAWTGAQDERALIRDNDGQWRRQSLLKPNPLRLNSLVGSSGTDTRPDVGASATDWTNPNDARDSDEATFAECTIDGSTTPVTRPITYTFTGATLLDGQILQVDLSTSSIYLPRDSDVDRPFSLFEDFIASVQIEVDQGDGFVEVADYPFPRFRSLFTLPLDGGSGGTGTFADLQVRITYTYIRGTVSASLQVYDIMVSSGASPTAITAGTYSYVTTTKFRKTLTDGRVIEIESAPSDVLTVDATGGPYYSIILDLPARRNNDIDGYDSGQLTRCIYRTTSTGSWPNLGLIAETDAISRTSFVDTFEVSGTTLGIPSVNIVSIGNSLTAGAGQAPAIYDAAFFRSALVVIPAGDRRRFAWSLPGFPEYFPVGQSFPLLSSNRNDELCGVTVLNGSIVLFLRTKVVRVRALPFADDPGFSIAQIDRDDIAPNNGLAGSPKAYCQFQAQNGASAVAWVSDNGIWMTDGSAPDEDGLGAKMMTSAIDWEQMVDTTRLDETVLEFDPVTQIIYFDYYDPDGNQRCLTLHTSEKHWHQIGGGQTVPKIMGPHHISIATSRAFGELGGRIHHWSCNTTTLFNERTGTTNAGSEFPSYLESGWNYPNGPLGEAIIAFCGLDHSDWGIGETCRLRVEARHDTDGDVAAIEEEMNLAGDRISHKFFNLGGQSIRFAVTHTGKTSSLSVPSRAIGPILLLGGSLGDLEGNTA